MESLPYGEGAQLWSVLTPKMQGLALGHLRDIARTSLIEELDTEALIATGRHIDVDTLVEVVDTLPENVTDTLIESLNAQDKQRLETQLSYAKGTAGRLMRTDVMTVRPDISLDCALRYLHRHGMTAEIDSLIAVNRQNKY